MTFHPSGRLELDSIQLQRVLTQIPFSVVMYEGPDHRAVFSNAAHDEMTGGRIRLGVPVLQSIPELAGQEAVQMLDVVYATGESHYAAQMAAQLHRNGRLETCWFRVCWQPVMNGSGRTVGVIVSSIEVTQLVETQHELEAARAESKRLAALLDD